MDARENILLIRLKSIGDIVFTLPAVHAVRENFPRAKLHFLVSKENAQILRGFADVDEIIALDRAVYRSVNLPAMGARTFQLLRRLRRENFSLAIDFHGLGETALLSWWSGAPERWGSVHQVARGWAYTHGVRHGGAAHPVEENLNLLRQCGLDIGRVRNEYVLPDDALTEARRFFAANHLDAGRPTLFIQPFTSNLQKNWPLENFLKLARYWQKHGVQIIFGGGPSERAALEAAPTKSFCIAAGTSLLVSSGLMKLSTLVIGADTGLLHLAVAMGKRVVMLMRSNTRCRTHSFQHPDWTIAAPDGQPLSGVEFNTVIEASAQTLDGAIAA